MSSDEEESSQGSGPERNFHPVPLFEVEGPRIPCRACQGKGVRGEICAWEAKQKILLIEGHELQDEGFGSKQVRFELYRSFVRHVYGRLGLGKRKMLPSCVEDVIRMAFPKEKSTGDIGPFVGFRNAKSTSENIP